MSIATRMTCAYGRASSGRTKVLKKAGGARPLRRPGTSSSTRARTPSTCPSPGLGRLPDRGQLGGRPRAVVADALVVPRTCGAASRRARLRASCPCRWKRGLLERVLAAAKTFSSSHAMGAGPIHGTARTVSTAQKMKRFGQVARRARRARRGPASRDRRARNRGVAWRSPLGVAEVDRGGPLVEARGRRARRADSKPTSTRAMPSVRAGLLAVGDGRGERARARSARPSSARPRRRDRAR